MPALDHLAGLFYSDLAELGTFEEVLVVNTPEPYRRLLAHHEHMTVAVERYHCSPVDVEVLEAQRDGDFYSRKILLHCRTNDAIVLFGVPRLNLKLLDEDVRREILSQNTPLGRVLIEHNVMREVQLGSLYRVEPGPDLCRMFRLQSPQTTYGRTAFIYLDGYLAIELLEIVAPAREE
jgi:hypothetical protein